MAKHKVISNLLVQSMLFDMAIDWETLSLEPKTKDEIPFWQKRYKDKRNNSDFDEYFDIDRE